MSATTADTGVTGSLGLAGMLGGGLFVVVYVGLAAVGDATYGTAYTFQMMSAVPVLFWMGGTVGLYLRHRRAFGWLGRVGTAVLLAGFLLSVVNSGWLLVADEPFLPEAAQWGYLLAEVLGVLLVGAAVVRARELTHAVSGGLLFALGLPASLALYMLLFEVLALLSNPVLGALLFTAPFGAAWVVLGLDMVVERDRMATAAAGDLDGV